MRISFNSLFFFFLGKGKKDKKKGVKEKRKGGSLILITCTSPSADTLKQKEKRV